MAKTKLMVMFDWSRMQLIAYTYWTGTVNFDTTSRPVNSPAWQWQGYGNSLMTHSNKVEINGQKQNNQLSFSQCLSSLPEIPPYF